MKRLLKLIQGMLVGTGSILPGVSGSMIAAILNIYESLVSALNRFLRQPIHSILSVWEYIIGIILGLFFGFFIIRLFLDIAPLPITLLFIGFILGGVPGLIRPIKKSKTTWKHGLTLTIAMISMFVLLLIKESSAAESSLLIVFVIGLITAISLIIPGLSGATMLMALGFYENLLDLISALIKGVMILDGALILSNILPFIVLVVSIIIGLILMGKLMYILLSRYKKHFYMAVLGIVLVSPINIYFTLEENTETPVFQTDWYFWVTGIILLLAGCVASFYLSNKTHDMEETIGV